MFFNFPVFTDFERAVTLLLVKIFLNFENGKKAMSKVFLKPLINFLIQWSLHAQKTVWIRVPRPIFAVALCSNREYLGGGAGVWGSSFPQQVTCPYKEWSERSVCYWPTAVGSGILSRRQRSEEPNFVWAFQPSCAHPKLPPWKGLNYQRFIY